MNSILRKSLFHLGMMNDKNLKFIGKNFHSQQNFYFFNLSRNCRRESHLLNSNSSFKLSAQGKFYFSSRNNEKGGSKDDIENNKSKEENLEKNSNFNYNSSDESTSNSSKMDFYQKYSNFNEFAFKNKKNENNNYKNDNSNNNQENKSNDNASNEYSNSTRKKVRSSYVENKRIDLLKIYKPDLFYFKLQEDFDLNDLKKKYLELAKLYHPDLRTNDEYSNFQFNKLKDSYERLKRFAELRDELFKMQNQGSITFNLNDYEQENVSKRTYNEKEEYIKHLLLEEEFGEIKEPKLLQQTLLMIWIIIGIIVFFIDLRKYMLMLQKRREGVVYL